MDANLLPLFQMEAEGQCVTLSEGLMALEVSSTPQEVMDGLMRAAHALKGAAAVVGLDMLVELAHAMEDYFTASIQSGISPDAGMTDLLLEATDMMASVVNMPADGCEQWQAQHQARISALIQAFIAGEHADVSHLKDDGEPEVTVTPAKTEGEAEAASMEYVQEQQVRLSAQRLDALMALAGEVQLSAQEVQPVQQHLWLLQKTIAHALSNLGKAQHVGQQGGEGQRHLQDVEQALQQCHQGLAEHLDALHMFERKISGISQRLSYEVMDSRMQKFADAVPAFRRLVRDVARELGKQVRLEVIGEDCDIDRDMMEKIQAPMQHILRNAVDHGVETPEVRRQQGKDEEAVVCIHAYHQGGRLMIQVKDDGQGVHLDALRQSIVEKGLSTADMVEKMSKQELLDFLLLPQFTMKQEVSRISGRGVGLDLVANTIRLLRGQLMIHSESGQGSCFEIHLPLSLSIARCLLVVIHQERYAIHLSRIQEVQYVSVQDIHDAESCPYMMWQDEPLVLVSAARLLGHESAEVKSGVFVVVLPWRQQHYGLMVDGLDGEGDIIEKPLDTRLGKVPDISGAAVGGQGQPLLVLDIDDVILSMQSMIEQGQVERVSCDETGSMQRKSILIVEDSITVREAERRMLENQGYQVYTAVDGMDGWHALRRYAVDLVISDIDMPRMNGIELLRLIRAEYQQRDIPVMIVSYKDREEDRLAGMEAGANYYLTKSSFHDNTMLQGVRDLIGDAYA